MKNTPDLSESDLAFAKDILAGLSERPKRLSSKYFYDATGDRLFQQIMALPEYYLTRAEYSVFEHQSKDIIALFEEVSELDVIELGAGDGTKTRLLLDAFLAAGKSIRYRPVDISGSVLSQLKNSCSQWFPQLEVAPVTSTYLEALDLLKADENRPKLVLFLGGNIGNMERVDAIHFLSEISTRLADHDRLLLGIDLKKDPQTIRAAYNDSQGVTRAFNLNLLTRINASFDADFDTSKFIHEPTYNPVTGAARSYLVSTEQQTVWLSKLNAAVQFEAWEAIQMELSLKYSQQEIKELGKAANLSVERLFFADQSAFTDVVMRP